MSFGIQVDMTQEDGLAGLFNTIGDVDEQQVTATASNITAFTFSGYALTISGQFDLPSDDSEDEINEFLDSPFTGLMIRDPSQRIVLSISGVTGLSLRDLESIDFEQKFERLLAQGVRILGSPFNDVLLGDTGADTLIGAGGSDELRGLGGNDELAGLNGNDTLHGGAGSDLMTGGAGNDRYEVESAGDQVMERPGEGVDEIHTNISLALPANVENLSLLGSLAINGFGNSAGNTILGNAARNVLMGGVGDDWLDGHGGIDVLAGGSGNDTYVIDHLSEVNKLAADAGVDHVQSPLSYALGPNQENLTLTGAGNINGAGTATSNTLSGNAGHNSLNGGAGDDRILGNAGNDALIGGAGNDALIGGAGNDTLAGGRGDDVLKGGAGRDVLVGGAGNDVLAGGADIDKADFSGLSTAIVVDLAARTATGNGTDKLSGIENVTGGAGNDTLSGDARTNVLVGGVGDDVLAGVAGNDTLKGGAGDDTYFVSDGPDDPFTTLSMSGNSYILNGDLSFTSTSGTFNISLGDLTNDGLVDTINVSYVDNIGYSGHWWGLSFSTRELDQNLVPGFYDDAMRYPFETTGHPGLDVSGDGRGSNTVTGNFTVVTADFDYSGASPQVLDFTVNFEHHSEGGPGTVTGTLKISLSENDSVIEAANKGTDTVFSSITYELPANVENLVLGGDDAIDGTGNGLSNSITGNLADNSLNGGAGGDTLTGGAGNDIFIFDAPLGEAATIDTITDFDGAGSAAEDEIHVDNGAGLFQNVGVDGALSGAAFESGAGLTEAATAEGRIIYDTATGALYYDSDGSGEAAAVQFAVIATVPAALDESDFLIV
ncbi:MAG: calcium-binding protein [Gammaproteobacteria bacterium]|nr:calcium-binding protein [Gammaproteobacteria bacterium]